MTDHELLDCFLVELRELMEKYGAAACVEDGRVEFEILPTRDLRCRS